MAATPTKVAMNSEYWPSETLKPANSIVASEGIGRQALSPTIRRKTPIRPISSTTSTAKLTIGSVIDAKNTRARVAACARGDLARWMGGSMRGSVSDEIRCLARCGARRMSVLGRSILRIITAWSTFAATAGRCATS